MTWKIWCTNWWSLIFCADAFDTEELLECVEKLKLGQSVHVPIYDFVTHRKSTDSFRQVCFCNMLIFNLGSKCFMEILSWFSDFMAFFLFEENVFLFSLFLVYLTWNILFRGKHFPTITHNCFTGSQWALSGGENKIFPKITFLKNIFRNQVIFRQTIGVSGLAVHWLV